MLHIIPQSTNLIISVSRESKNAQLNFSMILKVPLGFTKKPLEIKQREWVYDTVLLPIKAANPRQN